MVEFFGQDFGERVDGGFGHGVNSDHLVGELAHVGREHDNAGVAVCGHEGSEFGGGEEVALVLVGGVERGRMWRE